VKLFSLHSLTSSLLRREIGQTLPPSGASTLPLLGGRRAEGSAHHTHQIMLTDDDVLAKVGRMPTKTTPKRSPKKIALRAAKAPKGGAKKAKAPAKRSHLEVRWIREWERQGGPELVEEFMFHPTRRWRADFAHIESKLLIEIEGGAYGGRHTRGRGFVEDLDKYATAWLHGYTVLRIGAHQVRGDIIRAVIGRLRGEGAAENSPESQSGPENSPESWGEGSGGAPAWLAGAVAGGSPGADSRGA
jgi:hypothetical protein